MCGADAADLNYLTQKKSPFSLSTQHENLFGKDVTVQTLRNPFGIHFNVFALQKSACIGLGKVCACEYACVWLCGGVAVCISSFYLCSSFF